MSQRTVPDSISLQASVTYAALLTYQLGKTGEANCYSVREVRFQVYGHKHTHISESKENLTASILPFPSLLYTSKSLEATVILLSELFHP